MINYCVYAKRQMSVGHVLISEIRWNRTPKIPVLRKFNLCSTKIKSKEELQCCQMVKLKT